MTIIAALDSIIAQATELKELFETGEHDEKFQEIKGSLEMIEDNIDSQLLYVKDE